MFLSDLRNLAVSTMEKDIQEIPLKTHYDSLPLEEEIESSEKYPSPRDCRRYNIHRNRVAKAKLAENLYFKYKQRLPRMTNEQKGEAIQKIKALRPSMKALKAFYISKGDSPETVELLVTPKNYPNLRKVWITKQQQEVLLDVIKGREAQHKHFIENGFY